MQFKSICIRWVVVRTPGGCSRVVAGIKACFGWLGCVVGWLVGCLKLLTENDFCLSMSGDKCAHGRAALLRGSAVALHRPPDKDARNPRRPGGGRGGRKNLAARGSAATRTQTNANKTRQEITNAGASPLALTVSGYTSTGCYGKNPRKIKK